MQPATSELVQRARFRLAALRDTLAAVKPATRHGLSARFLFNLSQEALRGYLAQIAQDPGDADDGAVQDAVRGVIAGAEFLHFLMSFVTGAVHERVPEAMASPLQQLAHPHVQRSRILVYYDWTPSNYSFSPGFPEQLRNHMTEALEDETHPAVEAVPDLFAVLSIPAAEQRNVLLHSALGHEVGHALVEQFPFPPAPLPEQLEQIGAIIILPRWQHELLADAWGCFLLGPASFLSLLDLSTQDEASDDHPCNYLRFSLMQRCLEKASFICPEDPPVDLTWLQGEVSAAVERSAPSQPDSENPVHFWAHQQLLQQLDEMISLVYANEGGYDRAAWDRECLPTGDEHSLVRRIRHCVPPDMVDHTKQEPSLASILTAGWVTRKHPQRWAEFRAQFPVDEEDAEYKALVRLNQLLLKAVEITSIRREWRATAQ